LAKAAFAEAILNRAAPFDGVGFEALREIFGLFAEILQQDLS
jgi:hypothetical protein